MMFCCCQNCLVYQEVSDDLQAMQIAHESQSEDVAKSVGRRRFRNEMSICNAKLTVIDIMAMTFVLKHHSSAHTIK